jgi:hypothetical protein
MLNKFQKNINYFPLMVDVVGSLLNNAVDLYVKAVDYHQISTTQIPTPVGAGIRRRPAIVAGFRPDWPESCRSSRIPGHLAGILAGSSQDGRLLIKWPGSGRFVPNSDKDCWNPAQMARYWPLLPEFVCVKY